MAAIVRAGGDENQTTLTPKEKTPQERAQEAIDAAGRYQPQMTGIPPTTTTTTTGGGITLPTDSQGNINPSQMTGQQIATITRWAQEQGVGVTPLGVDPDVLRQAYRPPTAQVGTRGYSYQVPQQATAPLSAYYGEYADLITKNPTQDGIAFREWLNRRATLLANAWDPAEPDYLGKGQSLWNTAGDMVANNPVLRGSMTPEQFLNLQYELAGGDAAYERARQAIAAAKPPPITTTREVSTYKITAAQAQAAVDDMSQQLLGRMASDEELARARQSMQKLLTATVTTTTRAETDPAHINVTQHTTLGNSPQDAANILQMRMQRGSEGMAYNAGTMFEEALRKMSG